MTVQVSALRVGPTRVSPPGVSCGARPPGMLAYMKRTTVKIPEALDAQLRHEAERRGVTISELTREALETHLGVSGPRRPLGAAAAGRSGRSDVSERIEEILAVEVPR